MSKANVKFETLNPQEKKLFKMRHSAEHVLTMAIRTFYPDMKMAMGPATDDGFYFDVDLGKNNISDAEFKQIEKEMYRIINLKLDFQEETISIMQARQLFKDNEYKQEWLDDIETKNEPVTIYWTGKGTKDEFVDLCSGPHIHNTSEIGVIKLLSIAGAYWRGDENNKMLTRIYGTAFSTKDALAQYLFQIEEAKRRDHRKLGKELDLFTFSDYVGSGLPLYTQKGALIRRLVTEYVESVQSKANYQQVWTPQIAKAELFKTSGHYDKYKDDMFRVVSNYSDEEFYLKPMNCPQHTQIYASRPRSYRDLPIRMTDFAMLYRDERPGELSGLARVRSFSQDDCHIFCREDQVDDEIDIALNMTKQIMNTFGFKYRYRLSTRDPQQPEKYLGEPELWDKVEQWAEVIMERNHIDYFPGPGEAAFYAPKMDLMATDALGREWQLSTIQIDFIMPQRFQLSYIESDGQAKTPVMIHRAIVGSPERFLMILIEHFGGAFPVWLSPTQAMVIPISDKTKNYAQDIFIALQLAGIRVEMNSENESMQKRIRNAEKEKIPYMVIVGEEEVAQHLVSIRHRGRQDLGKMSIANFLDKMQQQIRDRIA